eukprot:TRINITY_DN2324_c0_g1_i1.p1 TRINITY_DN2324_c0_g1~~TRINITY_DN2324_c0_g1_i1.p1  ORF type:complete len:175 (+),score=13.53 TRINITY_DN2324_c0_g1_i1:57-527(+)
MTLHSVYVIYGALLDVNQFWDLLSRQPNFSSVATRVCASEGIEVSNLQKELSRPRYLLELFNDVFLERFQLSLVAVPHDAFEGRSAYKFYNKLVVFGYLAGTLNLSGNSMEDWAQVNQKLSQAPGEHVRNVLRSELSGFEGSIGVQLIPTDCACCS